MTPVSSYMLKGGMPRSRRACIARQENALLSREQGAVTLPLDRAVKDRVIDRIHAKVLHERRGVGQVGGLERKCRAGGRDQHCGGRENGHLEQRWQVVA